ncbi:MAG: heme-copper oxidase subunit III [Candidatus Omnitrophica bacterium]|nr:heme-copper oxidase subunit III [Candidatus Omnitrophota bacterium]
MTRQPAATPPQDPRVNPAGVFGMSLFLVSLAVLFTASLVSYFVIRFRAEQWPPPGMPGLPFGLWWSTLIILISSVTIQLGLWSAKKDMQAAMKAFLSMTLLLGIAFLFNQWANWSDLLKIEIPPTVNLYAFTFYTLTGLHAAHVIGGLILLSVVCYKAFKGNYGSQYHPGITYSAMYWHFLDVVWVVLFVSLKFSF